MQQEKRVQSIAGQLEAFQRTSIRINASLAETEDALRPGISKLGGRPDFPENITWPVSKLVVPSWMAPGATGIPVDANGDFALPFIAQLRIADLKPYDGANLLPSSGILYFVYAGTEHGFDNGNPANWRVFYWANANELKPAFPPIPIPPGTTYRACTLSFQNEATLPHIETCWIGSSESPHAKLVLTQEQWDAYADFLYELRANQSIHQMLGHSDDVQPYALEGGYNLVRNEFFADSSKKLSENELQKEWEQSRLLLQIDDEVNGMRFGRDGRLYFFIRESDLRHNDFTKVWAIEQ
jgi:uncharacterized protein YwqG